ncbi:MAG: hypothetical protein COA54_01120 [Thiotrichaceae bacterium]|nr:MAG: hypothetical protein COA54_01120 [Thiotrichaceae bacterium]
MKILNTIFLITIINISGLGLTQAEEVNPVPDLKEYDVEIIIFEDTHARYLSSQNWDQAIQNTDEINTVENPTNITEIKEYPANFKSITPSILTAKYKRISASSEYNVLFYGAWRQSGLDKDRAFEIDINDLENAHVNQSENSLSGTFKLVLARFLHIYNELVYHRKPTLNTEKTIKTTTETSEITDEIYPLKSHRRMRSKEIHYIDHPLVGILIQINPVKKKAIEKL